MGYIQTKYFNQENKRFRVRSREKRKKHMAIVCHVGNDIEKKIVIEEMQKAIRRMNHLLQTGISYEMEIILERADLKI